ncbi:hypothetical protein, partial [Bacillus altitudinis]|uniref:hypothetical protein n=1 Tax=Bacillus altitudinis TaxID=293387 RepID=UPI0016438764
NAVGFEEEVIEKISKQVTNVMKQMMENGEVGVDEVRCMSEEEKEEIEGWKKREGDYGKDVCIREVVKEGIERQGEDLGLVEGEGGLRYEELGQEMHGVAGDLI